MTTIDDRQAAARSWFEGLRDQICAAFEAIEDSLASGPQASAAAGRFARKRWERRAAAAARCR